MKKIRTVTAASRPFTLAVDSGALPTEFRLFVKGSNATENGKFLFDDLAAKSVMAAYAAWGIDLPIDLEHQMIELDGGVADPTARDARGWCKLTLKPDGSLWACDVTWTPDGAKRLTDKTQRYVSPCFEADQKTKRITKMLNIAITALPATHKTPALVAASKNSKGQKTMDPSLVKQALEAIAKGDAKAALEILTGLVASAAGADPAPDGDEDGSEGEGAEGGAPPVTDSAAPPPAAPAADADEADEEDPKKKTERKAMRAMLRSITGTSSLAEALSQVEVYRASHIALETERTKLAKERATLESAERRKLVADLVKLGAEFPSTVWADDKQTAIKPRWAKMPIVELRSHVSEQRAARGEAPAKVEPLAPGHDPAVVYELSASELAICKSMNCDPKVFAALRAVRDGKKV